MALADLVPGAHPVVADLLRAFPGAEIIAVRSYTSADEADWSPPVREVVPEPVRPAREASKEWLDKVATRDRLLAAGEPEGERPTGDRTESQRVADASRVRFGVWTDYVVGTQPVCDQFDVLRVHPENELPMRETARLMAANGWSWYPQQRDEERKPSAFGTLYKPQAHISRNGKLFYKSEPRRVTCYHKQFSKVPPGVALSQDWIDVSRQDTNPTIKTGEGSQWVWCLDLDVEDQAASCAVRALMVEHLGVTPYDRVRSDSNKAAFLFRHAPEDASAFRNATINILGVGAVEFHCSGKQITWHGRHWRTDAVFRSSGPLPGMDPGATPELAPLVTAGQMRAFVAAVHALFADLIPQRARAAQNRGPMEVHAGDVGGVPVRRLVTADHPGTQREADGRVLHQRDPWIYAHARALCRLNVDAPDDAVVALMVEDALANLAVDDRMGEDAIVKKCEEKIRRRLPESREWAAANGRVRTVRVDGREFLPIEHVPTYHADRDIRALLPMRPGDRGERGLRVVRTAPDKAKAAERALLGDRRPVMDRVAAEIRAALTRFVRAQFDRAMGLGLPDMRVMVVPGPTGSGKTRTFLQVLREERARARNLEFEGTVTFAMMLPSYGLLEDVQSRLDAEERDARDVIAAGTAAGLRVMQYRGKEHRCSRLETLLFLTRAGIGTSGMCRSRSWEKPRGPDGLIADKADFESVEYRCPVWVAGECEFQNQKREVAESDLVLLPTAYITLPIPAELKEVSALVVDESVVGQFVRSMTLDPAVLRLPRKLPRLTKKEKLRAEQLQPGINKRQAHEDHSALMAQDREEANAVALDCIEARRDVALHLMTYARGVVTGYELAQTTLSIVGRASDVHEDVTYDLTPQVAQRLASRERDVGLLAEIRYWRLIVDRMDRLRADAAATAERDAKVARWRRLQLPFDTVPAAPVTANGDHDHRIRIQVDPETKARTVRMSWRPQNRFADVPTMLLDASADERMIGKVWANRGVEMVAVEAPLHLRTVWICDRPHSLRSRLPYKHKDIAGQANAARTLNRDRDFLTGLAGVMSHTRVVVSVPKQIEVAINTSWVPPTNVDWIHDGATVGLNFGEKSGCVLIQGATDIPIPAVDDEVAGWTFDDPDPEAPVDALGTGLDAAGEEVRCPLADVTTPTRDGSDVVTQMRRYEGDWARRVQLQSREEPMRQAIGRVRPVFKDGAETAPLVVVRGQVIPSGIVVDELGEDAVVLKRIAHYVEAARNGALPRRADGNGGGWPASPAWDALVRAVPDIYDDPACDHALGLSRHSYRRPDGRRLTVDVLAHVDPLDAIARFESLCDGAPFDPTLADVREDTGAGNEPVREAHARKPDRRMEELLGPMADRAAAERETLRIVRRMDAAQAWPQEVFAARLGQGAKAVLLTVRPRTKDDPANVLATLRNPAFVPEPPKAAPVEVAPEPVPPATEQVNDPWPADDPWNVSVWDLHKVLTNGG